MKILHISTYAHGGAGFAARRLNQQLVNEGVSSKMLVMNDRYSVADDNLVEWDLPSQAKGFRARFHQRRLRHLRQNLNLLKGRYDWASLPLSGYDITLHPEYKKADLIHLHWVADFLDYPSFFKKNRKPVVWTLHDMNPFSGCFHYDLDLKNNMQFFQDFNERIVEIKKRTFNKIKTEKLTFVCLCTWMQNELHKAKFSNRFHSVIIPNGIDTKTFKPVSDTKHIKERIGIEEDKKVILFVSDHLENKRKGFDLLLELIRIMDSTKYTFLAIGKKNDNSVDSRIQFVGEILDEYKMSELYAIADVFVSTARQDNLPNTVLESLASGTPVIGFNVGGIPDLVENGYNGLLVNLGDLASLALNLEKIINDSVLLEHLSKNAREGVLDKFTSTKQTESIIQLYKQVYI